MSPRPRLVTTHLIIQLSLDKATRSARITRRWTIFNAMGLNRRQPMPLDEEYDDEFEEEEDDFEDDFEDEFEEEEEEDDEDEEEEW